MLPAQQNGYVTFGCLNQFAKVSPPALNLWVEILQDVSQRVLPVTKASISTMLGELKGAALLRGARGSTPVDWDALVDVIDGIARFAQSMGESLDTLEVNPLRADGAQIEVLDALAVWRD